MKIKYYDKKEHKTFKSKALFFWERYKNILRAVFWALALLGVSAMVMQNRDDYPFRFLRVLMYCGIAGFIISEVIYFFTPTDDDTVLEMISSRAKHFLLTTLRLTGIWYVFTFITNVLKWIKENPEATGYGIGTAAVCIGWFQLNFRMYPIWRKKMFLSRGVHMCRHDNCTMKIPTNNIWCKKHER
jgi:hypothetical protein